MYYSTAYKIAIEYIYSPEYKDQLDILWLLQTVPHQTGNRPNNPPYLSQSHIKKKKKLLNQRSELHTNDTNSTPHTVI